MPKEKWEYKIIKLNPQSRGGEEILNELGKQGWELVSVVLLTHKDKNNPVQVSGKTYTFEILIEIEYFFKRKDK